MMVIVHIKHVRKWVLPQGVATPGEGSGVRGSPGAGQVSVSGLSALQVEM